MKVSKVVTVTPNPALDLGGTVDDLVPNEKSYVYDETRHPGGNAINAARIMSRLEVGVIASGFIGGGVGREVEDLLRDEGVRCQFVPISGHTRVSLTVYSKKTQRQTRLSFPGPKIQRHERDVLFSAILGKLKAPALVVIGGSLPPGFPPQDIRRMISECRKRDIGCVVDVPGHVLSKIITAGPLLIKPNLREFQDLTGTKVSTIRDVLELARKLTDKVPLICVSSVEGGALLISRRSAWFGTSPKVTVRTTVGAGDSMVGVMSAILSKWQLTSPVDIGNASDEQIGEILRWGLAGASATLETAGTALGSALNIRRFQKHVVVTEVDVLSTSERH